INYAAGLIVSTLAVGDLNGDGNPDFVVGNNEHTSVNVFLGNGAANYTMTTIATNYSVYMNAIGDLDGGGKLDLILASGLNVSVRLGNGDATFGPETDYATL